MILCADLGDNLYYNGEALIKSVLFLFHSVLYLSIINHLSGLSAEDGTAFSGFEWNTGQILSVSKSHNIYENLDTVII